MRISIHAPRTGSDVVVFVGTIPIVISIHAPRTGSDERCDCGCSQTDISIHAPRTGSDAAAEVQRAFAEQFQSTLPARGATPR